MCAGGLIGGFSPSDNSVTGTGIASVLMNQPEQPTNPTAGTDLLDPASIAARQRVARRIAEGLRSTFLTSSRGTEGAAGSGLGATPGALDGLPLVTDMTGRDFPEGIIPPPPSSPSSNRPATYVPGDDVPERNRRLPGEGRNARVL